MVLSTTTEGRHQFMLRVSRTYQAQNLTQLQFIACVGLRLGRTQQELMHHVSSVARGQFTLPSSSGRTAVSEIVNGGSNPSGRTNLCGMPQKLWLHL